MDKPYGNRELDNQFRSLKDLILGGTITTSGAYTIHTFTSSGTWTMVAAGGTNTSNFFNYIM